MKTIIKHTPALRSRPPFYVFRSTFYTNVIVVAIILALFASCQVEKKRYSNGFSIYKRGELSFSSQSCEPIDTLDSGRAILPTKEYAYNDIIVCTNVMSGGFEEQSIYEVDQRSDIIQRNKLNMNIHSLYFDKENDVIVPEKKTHPFALISFYSAVLSLISLALIMFTFAFVLFVMFLLISLVFGIISLIKIRNEPEKYKNRWMAIFGVIFSALMLILFVSVMIMVFNSLGW